MGISSNIADAINNYPELPHHVVTSNGVHSFSDLEEAVSDYESALLTEQKNGSNFEPSFFSII